MEVAYLLSSSPGERMVGIEATRVPARNYRLESESWGTVERVDTFRGGEWRDTRVSRIKSARMLAAHER